MHGRVGIPLRSRESFFGDPFFSDCWDPMDRQQKEWEQEYSDLPNRLVDDLDDIDLSFRRRLGHHSLRNRMFGRDRGTHDIFMNKERDLLKSSGSKTDTASATTTANSELQSDKENFKILLDVQQFKPEELSVNFSDGSIVIEGKKEDKKDAHGSLSCHFIRKYVVPADVKVESVQCNLSSDGVLHVTAPRLNAGISNKTNSSLHGSSSSSSETEQSAKAKKSDEAATATAHSSLSTASSSKSKDVLNDLRSSEREGKGSSSFREDDIFSNRPKSGLLRDAASDMRHRRHIFDSYFTGFPDYDMVPFWSRRRDLADGLSEAEANHSNTQKVAKSSSEVQSDSDNFKVQLDVSGFTPEELSVKVIHNYLVVEGKQEEKKDTFGSVYRNFTRKYEIPSDVKQEDIQCTFSSDRILTLAAVRARTGVGALKQNTESLNRSSNENLVPINVGSLSQLSASASASSPSEQASTASGTGTNSSSTATIGNRDGREHVVRIRLEQGGSSASKSNLSGQNEANGGRTSSGQKEVTKPAPYNSNLLEMLGTFSDDLKAIDSSASSGSATNQNGSGIPVKTLNGNNLTDEPSSSSSGGGQVIPAELKKYLPQQHDSNLLEMLEDFQGKLKTLSKSPPPERKDYTPA